MIAIRVSDDGQSGKVVPGSEDRARFHSIFGVPHGKAIAEQVFCRTADLELNLELPVANVTRLRKKERRDKIPLLFDKRPLSNIFKRDPFMTDTMESEY